MEWCQRLDLAREAKQYASLSHARMTLYSIVRLRTNSLSVGRSHRAAVIPSDVVGHFAAAPLTGGLSVWSNVSSTPPSAAINSCRHLIVSSRRNSKRRCQMVSVANPAADH